jgi:hypothetical protein
VVEGSGLENHLLPLCPVQVVPLSAEKTGRMVLNRAGLLCPVPCRAAEFGRKMVEDRSLIVRDIPRGGASGLIAPVQRLVDLIARYIPPTMTRSPTGASLYRPQRHPCCKEKHTTETDSDDDRWMVCHGRKRSAEGRSPGEQGAGASLTIRVRI